MGPRKRVTLQDIANRAGVSAMTVSLALRGGEECPLSPGTRARVREIAQELGYRPNRLARSLRARRSATVGVILSRVSNAFFAHMLEALEEMAGQHEHGLLIGCSHGSPQHEQRLAELFLEKAVDGLVVAPADPESNADYYRGLLEEGVPLVFVDRGMSGVAADTVTTDHRRGGYLAGQHLRELGRRRVAFLGPPARPRLPTSIADRLEGLNLALTEAGLPPAMVLHASSATGLSEEGYASAAVSESVASGAEIDALFSAHDALAYPAIGALTAVGLRVPEDVAVVGFDDLPLSAHFMPPLTTVRQPVREIGVEASRRLLAKIISPSAAPEPQRILLEPTLIVRRSCGAVAPPAIP